MEIEKTFLVVDEWCESVAFAKVYLSNGRYFIHGHNQPIQRLTDSDFLRLKQLTNMKQ